MIYKLWNIETTKGGHKEVWQLFGERDFLYSWMRRHGYKVGKMEYVRFIRVS